MDHRDDGAAAHERHRWRERAFAGRDRAAGNRAGGLAGPTTRYVIIVGLLAGTASLPILATLGSGSATTSGPVQGGTMPFIEPPPDRPAVVPLPPPAPLDQAWTVPRGPDLVGNWRQIAFDDHGAPACKHGRAERAERPPTGQGRDASTQPGKPGQRPDPKGNLASPGPRPPDLPRPDTPRPDQPRPDKPGADKPDDGPTRPDEARRNRPGR